MTVPGVGHVVTLTYRYPRRGGSLPELQGSRGGVWADAFPASIRRDQPNRRDIKVRGRDDAGDALRSSPDHAGAFDEVVLAQGLGHEDRQAPRDEEGDRGDGAPVGGDHAPHLGGRHRVPRATSTPRVAESLKVLDSKRPIREADI